MSDTDELRQGLFDLSAHKAEALRQRAGLLKIINVVFARREKMIETARSKNLGNISSTLAI